MQVLQMLQVEYVHYMIVGVGGIRPHRCSKYVIDYCLRVGEVTYAFFFVISALYFYIYSIVQKICQTKLENRSL